MYVLVKPSLINSVFFKMVKKQYFPSFHLEAIMLWWNCGYFCAVGQIGTWLMVLTNLNDFHEWMHVSRRKWIWKLNSALSDMYRIFLWQGPWSFSFEKLYCLRKEKKWYDSSILLGNANTQKIVAFRFKIKFPAGKDKWNKAGAEIYIWKDGKISFK